MPTDPCGVKPLYHSIFVNRGRRGNQERNFRRLKIRPKLARNLGWCRVLATGAPDQPSLHQRVIQTMLSVPGAAALRVAELSFVHAA
jgi:hypothetical protein